MYDRAYFPSTEYIAFTDQIPLNSLTSLTVSYLVENFYFSQKQMRYLVGYNSLFSPKDSKQN